MLSRNWFGYGNRWPALRTDLERLQEEMSKLYSGAMRTIAPEYPAVNVWANADAAVVTIELPGVATEDLDISVVGSALTVKGKRDTNGESGKHHRRERVYGSFSRAIDLPFEVDQEKIDAKLANGILNITLPRAEADKPRKIKVKAV